MAIDWNDNTKRKAFREALQEAYPSNADLEIFVDEELNENLATVSGGTNLQITAHGLINWARAKGQLDKVYEAFKEQNRKHSIIEKLERQSFVSPTPNLTQSDWDSLFELFLPDDLADLQRAFQKGFKEALGFPFRQAQPRHPPLVEIPQIRELLEFYDVDDRGPLLAARVVECVIVEIRRSSEGSNRDLTALEQWHNCIAQQYQIPPLAPEPEQKPDRQGYLLVTCEESGSHVIVYPELRVSGEEKPIKFGASPVKCAFEQVPAHLSEWIYQGEKALEGNHDSEEILIELFLPCALLEEDLATWEVKDKRGKPISLGLHRLFVVRSFDRIQDTDVLQVLERKWQLLKECVRNGTACDQFHLQEKYLEQKGALLVLLKKVPGLKLVAELPSEQEKRKDWLYEIIDAAIPITLWSPQIEESILTDLKTQMHYLARESQLTNFADLAYRWREKLAQPETELVKHIRLFCDCPNRLPRLPDLKNREDDDALVAS